MERPIRRTSRIFLVVLIAVIFLVGGFTAGVATDRAGMVPGAPICGPTSAPQQFGVFWEAWNLVQKYYVDRAAINDTNMTYGAISGMLDSLGDTGHTRFLSPQALRDEEEALSGKFEGIGAHIMLRDGRPTIVAPIPGSPALEAGIKPGDVILKVDGKDVTGLSLDQVVNQVRGPAGTSVTLTILHPDASTPTDITVERAQINIPSVSWAIVPGTSVAHVWVSQFADGATTELVAALQAARKAGATAVALDLRDDPGGLRDEAVGVASQFLQSGNVLIEVDAQGHRTEYPVKPDGAALDTPLVVLVNEGTASSAEIVAGAIQDHKRAQIVGETTTGTGTVLSIFHLSDGSAVFLGTEGWLTPDGREIWHHGIAPDIVVPMAPGVLPLIPEQEQGMSPGQLQSSQDAQLLRAVQLLSQPAPAR